jgi:hypothetical protein
VVEKIISGGQTGADRAALDWAMARQIPHGGYCPKGRIAEDGIIDPKYQLLETPSMDYVERTELNIIHSDGTVVLSIGGVLDGGSKDTVRLAKKHGKPLIHIRFKMENPGLLHRQFAEAKDIAVLNVAGPRASKEPEVAAFVLQTLEAAFPLS